MAITAFVGLIDDEDTDLCPRGNGKTNAMTYYLYKYHIQNYEVWTNYFTTFSILMGFQEMINKLREVRKAGDKRKIVMGVTEIQDLINSMGSEQAKTLFVDAFINQLRKLNADLLYDTQVLKNVQIRLRRQTENVRIPMKLHSDGNLCNFDRCERQHMIDVFSHKPFMRRAIRRIKAYEVGKLYNTAEMVVDRLEIIKEEKTTKKKVEVEEENKIADEVKEEKKIAVKKKKEKDTNVYFTTS